MYSFDLWQNSCLLNNLTNFFVCMTYIVCIVRIVLEWFLTFRVNKWQKQCLWNRREPFLFLVENSPSHLLLYTYILRKSRNKKDKYSFDLQLMGDTTYMDYKDWPTPQKVSVCLDFSWCWYNFGQIFSFFTEINPK